MKLGDAVYLLAGTRTPYLVRRLGADKQTRNRFRFLVEAYVHVLCMGKQSQE